MSQDASTRARILEVAAGLFAEHGFRRVTVRDICHAARVNVAAVNYHFGDKLGLYQEVVQSAIDAMRATTDAARRAGEGLPVEQRLARFVGAFVERLLTGSGTVHRLIHREITDPTPALDRLVEEGVRPRVKYLSGIVAEVLGCAPSDERVQRSVFSIQAQSLAVAANPITARLGFAPTRADAAAIADHITRFSLAGMRGLARPCRRPRPRAAGLTSSRAAAMATDRSGETGAIAASAGARSPRARRAT